MDSSPYVHVIDGKHFTNQRNLQRELDNMELTGVTNGQGDLYEVIEFAAKLPFRAGVGKSLVIVSCEECGRPDTQAYADTLNILLEADMRLHLLYPTKIGLKGEKIAKPLDAPVGFDDGKVFTLKDSRDLQGDRNLKERLAIEKDFCMPLAIETKGSVFTMNFLRDRPNRIKKLWSVFGQRLSETALPSPCLRCDCVPDRSGMGRTMCHPCIPPSLSDFFASFDRLEYSSS
ncbi:unnamed protein product [Darwinula stevensoni]|uniref:Uncharacterized protein n=1 Tax=Darwinula stevensoni TaxID=69355 RepID=A0A7R9ADR1_9CRUS|nr:unnamed protein product [Darwinula stevensoni]CAG0901553.1 unnamed protein product [Darwinula stevensoni]